MTPGDGKLSSALYAVLGRDMALGFTPVRGEGEDVTVTGFVSLPACCRGQPDLPAFFFVNGRPVKSKLLMAALERAYENQKMVGKVSRLRAPAPGEGQPGGCERPPGQD